MPALTGSRRRRLWICRFAWTTQTRCPHTHSRPKSSSRKLLDLKDKGRRDHTLTSAILGPRFGVHFNPRIVIANLMRFVVRHIGKTGSAAHGASQQGFVFLSCHPANMRPESVIFQRGPCHNQIDPLPRKELALFRKDLSEPVSRNVPCPRGVLSAKRSPAMRIEVRGQLCSLGISTGALNLPNWVGSFPGRRGSKI